MTVTVKCRFSLLQVEKFKQSQNAKNALHSRFDIKTSNAIYRDDEFEHLQIDCIALYLIFLVQMITSGLQVSIFTEYHTFRYI